MIIQEELAALSDPEDAQFLQRYFKTGPGQYGAGDQFRGIRVPVLRQVAKSHRHLAQQETLELLGSPYHEDRLLALLIWTLQYDRSEAPGRRAIFEAYLAHTRWINNWDLVDLSAPSIVGAELFGKNHAILTTLAGSRSLWERRIAILSTFYFLRRGEFQPTLQIAEILLNDPHDLIHKAVGWMLREIGKRDQDCEEAFLQHHLTDMPRTMLRYAIERFEEQKRRGYLKRR